MTTTDIADALAASRGISRAEAKAVVKQVFDLIVANAAKGEVALAGFGKFTVSSRPARAGRNPRTGEVIVISPSKRIKFTPAKGFKDGVAR